MACKLSVTLNCSPLRSVNFFSILKCTLYLLSSINNALSALFENAYDFTFSASALHLSLCPLHVYGLYTACGAKRQKLYVLLILASVPYMSLFVYDTVCIGSPGTTSASGSTSAHGRVKVKVTLQIRIQAKVTSPTRTRREELPGGGFPEELAQK